MQSLAELRVCFAPGLRLHSFCFPGGFYRADEVPKWSLILWVGEGKWPPEWCSQENESLLLRHRRGATSVSWQVGSVGGEMGFKPCQGMQCSWREKAEPPCPGKCCRHWVISFCFSRLECFQSKLLERMEILGECSSASHPWEYFA